MTDLLEYIKKMQEMYGDDVITTADKLERQPKALEQQMFRDFDIRNPKADGGQLVAPSVDGSRPGYQGKDYIPGYNIKERIINEKKYQKVLTEMLNELDVMKEKGYGNVSNLVEKYSDKLGPTKGKTKKYYKADGSFGGLNWNTEQRKIRGAVIDAAKQADITDLPDNMIKAVEDYKKFKGKITRGETAKIIKANKVPESSLYKALNKVNAFVKQKKKYKNIDEKNKIKAAERRAALKKYSSDGFERMTKGSLTIQGGHTGDIYNEFVTPKTKKYTPAFINQETLKEYDALIKSIGEARDKAIKAKNFKEVERLNVKGMAVSAGSEGYKTFKVVQPDGSSYIYGIDDITTTDPMNLTKVDTVQELTKGKDVEFEKAKKLYKAKKISKAELEVARAAAEKRLFEAGTHRDLIKVQKKEAMKAAKLSKKDIKSLDKRLTENLNFLEKNLSSKHQQLIKDQFCPGNKNGLTPGSCPINEAMDNMIKQTNDVKRGVVKGAEATRIANKASKVARFGTGKGLAKVLGPYGIAAEALFEVAFAVPGYARGESGKRLLGDSIFGLIPGVGQSAEEEFAEYATKAGMSELEQQKIKDANRFLELNQSLIDAEKAGVLEGRGVGRGVQNRALQNYIKLAKEYNPLFDQFVGAPPSQDVSAIFAEQDRINQLIQADQAERAEKRNIALKEDFMAAEGGIASGPPPTEGPMSQGLRSLYNNGKKL